MQTKIAACRPPNFAAIDAAFHVAGQPGILFAYGDTIFNPSNIPISPWLIDHEMAHGERQGKDIESWWDRYIKDASFRLTEEIYAHRQEYRSYLRTRPNRHMRRSFLANIAHRLASSLYGRMISLEGARNAILADDFDCGAKSSITNGLGFSYNAPIAGS